MVIFSSSSQVAYAYINHSLADDLSLSITQIALISSIYTWIFAFCQFFSGSIITFLGIRKVFLFLTFMILVGFFIFINANSIYLLFLAQFFIALGASFAFVGAGYAGGVWFGFEKYGLMFGLTQSFASMGAFFAGSLYANLMANGEKWSNLLFYIACYGVFTFFLIFLYVKDPQSSKKNLHVKVDFDFFKNVTKTLLEVFKMRAVLVNAICGGVSFGVFLSMATLWCPKLLMSMGFNEADAGQLTSLNWIGIAIGCIFIHKISDRLKNRRFVFCITSLFQAIFLLILICCSSKSYIFVGFLVLAFGYCSSSQMLSFTIAGESIKTSYIGTSAAIINGAMFIIAGFIMAISGKFLKGDSLMEYQNVLVYLPLSLLFASFLIFLTKESFGKKLF